MGQKTTAKHDPRSVFLSLRKNIGLWMLSRWTSAKELTLMIQLWDPSPEHPETETKVRQHLQGKTLEELEDQSICSDSALLQLHVLGRTCILKEGRHVNNKKKH